MLGLLDLLLLEYRGHVAMMLVYGERRLEVRAPTNKASNWCPSVDIQQQDFRSTGGKLSFLATRISFSISYEIFLFIRQLFDETNDASSLPGVVARSHACN